MNSKIIRFVLGLSLFMVIVLIAIFGATKGQLDRVEVVTESDGHRQVDHKYLNLIPYSEAEKDPKLTVTSDAQRALAETGLKNLPEVTKKEPGWWVTREIYGKKVTYVYSVPTAASEIAISSFYASQLKDSNGSSSKTYGHGAVGLCPDGKSHLEVLVDPSSKRFLLEITP